MGHALIQRTTNVENTKHKRKSRLTSINVLLRGQSNMIFLAEGNGYLASNNIVSEVQWLLGFDGVNDKVELQYERFDPSAATVTGGTPFLGPWVQPIAGDWHNGWQNAFYENSILNFINTKMTAAERADPTAVVWLHSEGDSTRSDLTAREWVSGVAFDAAQIRAALGQSAATVPYLFVDAHPYWGTASGHQAIRQGMEYLARDPNFNADIAARALDVNADRDDFDGNPTTREYGGPHLSDSDTLILSHRIALTIAEEFAAYAKPGSVVALGGGNIDDHGPQVINAVQTGASQLVLTVGLDQATNLLPLDPDAARGLGFSVHIGEVSVDAVSTQLLDANHLLVDFAGAIPPFSALFYGHGSGRLGGESGGGQGNAIYDNQGMPLWVSASGLGIGPGIVDAPLL